MTKLKLFEWNKKTRTVLRSIKPGDIFMFKIEDEKFGTGRIMSKVDFGHVAELLDCFSDSPQVSAEALQGAKRIGHPIVLASYTLFDKKLTGDWRIVAHEDGYSVSAREQIFFSYGAGMSFKRIDIFGKEVKISKSEAEKLPIYSPREDWDIKEMVAAYQK